MKPRFRYQGQDVGENDGVGRQSTGPVGINGLTLHALGADILEVGSPVDAGGYDEGIGAMLQSGAVVRNVGNVLILASGGSTHGVSVLRDQNATAVDQSVCGVTLGVLVVPATGELNVHGNGGANRLSAQVEGGVADAQPLYCV